MVAVTQLPLTNSHQPQPHSAPGRWRPQRAGILNIWRYYDETFTFHNGRLLLRGQNGTGKSKALELLLPFLFDANLRPNRLSTFGGSERTMHWNLMGEGTQGKTRVGYVWMEFAKPHPDTGELKWFTCGARLQASVHTSTVHPDYFTTSQRIDPHTGLSLVNESGQPLTRQALTDALHGQGEMHASAADYRTTVRQTLFDGMTEQRYEALITALLQLRQPKLSERLDPSLLSALLSRALPPLGHGEITELAEGFERLDRQREQLKQLDEEVTAATHIATQQRGYTQRVLRAAAATLISATTDMDNYTRTARESADNLHQATTKHTEGTERLNELRQREQELEGAIEGLIDSDDYKKGKELDRLRRRTEEAQATARTCVRTPPRSRTPPPLIPGRQPALPTRPTSMPTTCAPSSTTPSKQHAEPAWNPSASKPRPPSPPPPTRPPPLTGSAVSALCCGAPRPHAATRSTRSTQQSTPTNTPYATAPAPRATWTAPAAA
ncbi:hypothetical protein [Streptomyces anulatus]|uniref:hypothetical protein n=1 Tax=Streptomyces anulatus TaxID=1892 RepID=UPI0020B73C98|nr:hypothetical protein [Streptomyces anulatus]